MPMFQLFRKGFQKFIRGTGYIIAYGCIVHCTFEFIGEFVVCKGASMEPTVYSDDVILTEHISTRMNSIDRGDVVIARSPVNPHKYICKRVHAISGDRVRYGLWTQIVPRGHLWLRGDNENNSTDSRNFGPVPQGLIKGRAIFRIWPLSSFGVIDSNTVKEKS